MLLGFFRSFDELECDCRVALFVDRAWVLTEGSARVIRDFVIQVDEKSKFPLTRIVMVLPNAKFGGFEDISHTLLDPAYHLNDRGIFWRYSLKKPATPVMSPLGEARLGEISEGGFPNLQVMDGIRVVEQPFLDAVRVQLDLPVPLDPGRALMARVTFVGRDVLVDDGGDKCKNLRLRYFDSRHCPNAVDALDKERTAMEVMPIVVDDKGNRRGGFDIALLFPPTLEVGAPGPLPVEMVKDLTTPQGRGDVSYRKYIWRARNYWDRPLLPCETPIQIECCDICPPDTTGEDVKQLRGEVSEFVGSFSRSLHEASAELRVGTRLAILGLIVSLVALVLGVVTMFRPVSGAAERPERTVNSGAANETTRSR